MAKYQSRFDNFFLNLRLNRAEFGDMAAFTLEALRQSPEVAAAYPDIITDLAAAHAAYTSSHAGQLSGTGKEATATVGQALEDFRAYVKRVERKHINPAYDAGSPDLLAIFPKGRAWLTARPQAQALDAFTAFLAALDAREDAFPAAVRTEGRTLHTALARALQLADSTAATSDAQRADLHDGREATCQQLLRAYAALLLLHYRQPERVAGFFDLSKANLGGRKNKPATLPTAK